MTLQKLIDHACDGEKRAIMASYVGAENAANPSVELLEMMHDVTLQNGVAKLIQSWIDPDDWRAYWENVTEGNSEKHFWQRYTCDACGVPFTQDEWDERETPHRTDCPNYDPDSDEFVECDCDRNYHSHCFDFDNDPDQT